MQCPEFVHDLIFNSQEIANRSCMLIVSMETENFEIHAAVRHYDVTFVLLSYSVLDIVAGRERSKEETEFYMAWHGSSNEFNGRSIPFTVLSKRIFSLDMVHH